MDTHPSDRIDTVVAGGGLAGLVTALTAARVPGSGRVVLLDAHPLGGRARCDQRDGFVFNRGPRAIYVGGPGDRILTNLGIDTTAGGPPATHASVGLDGGRAHLLPQGPLSALRTSLMTPGEKLTFARAFTRIPRIDPSTLVGRTVTQWLDGMGLHGAPRRMVEGLIRVATYTDAPEVFDAGAALANAQAGIDPGVRYLDGGWQTIVDALAAACWDAGVERRDASAEAIAHPLDEPDLVRVETSAGPILARSAVLATGGPEAAAAVLGGAPPSWSVLGPPVTAACLELGVARPPARRFAMGLDEPTYLSTHAPPARLAPEGQAVVHVMRYQRPGDTLPAADQRAQLDRVAAQAGIVAEDIVTHRFLARMVVSGGLPTAAGGGLAGRPSVAVEGHPGVFVAGDWVGPEGLLLDAVASSASTAGRQAAARSATMAAA